MSQEQPRLITMGQVLGALRARRTGRLERNDSLDLSVAGAEYNLAIGVNRLGVSATWLGHVGADALGELALRELRAEGVEVCATVDPHRPTALMITQARTADRRRVWYYRRDAAGAGLAPPDLADIDWTRFEMLHVTGITACLGADPAGTVRAAVSQARQAGVTVSLDLNHRLALADAATFADTLQPVLAKADIVFATTEEAALVTGSSEPKEQARLLLNSGPETVLVKLGERGSLLATADGLIEQAAVATRVVDPVGAGDAFAAGFLAGRLAGRDPVPALEQAARVAAVAVATTGDWEGLPTSAELAALAGAPDVTR